MHCIDKLLSKTEHGLLDRYSLFKKENKMNLPTKITISRIIIIILMIIALFVMSLIDFKSISLGNSGIDLTFFIVCIIFCLASFTDWLDGYLARKNNQVTSLGKFLDPVADKLLINSLVIFLIAPSIFAPYNSNANQISFNMWCAIILVARDIVVDALRFIAAQKNIVIAANIFGKAKTVLEMVAIIFVLLNGWPFNYFDNSWPIGLHITDFIVYIATFVSFISGVIYVWQNRKVFKESDNKNE